MSAISPAGPAPSASTESRIIELLIVVRSPLAAARLTTIRPISLVIRTARRPSERKRNNQAPGQEACAIFRHLVTVRRPHGQSRNEGRCNDEKKLSRAGEVRLQIVSPQALCAGLARTTALLGPRVPECPERASAHRAKNHACPQQFWRRARATADRVG